MFSAWVGELEQSGEGVAGKSEPVESAEDRLLDMVMLRLRLRDGLDLQRVAEEFGEDAADGVAASVQGYVGRGLVEFVASGEADVTRRPVIRLADPAGLLVSNDIISEIFSVVGSD